MRYCLFSWWHPDEKIWRSKGLEKNPRAMLFQRFPSFCNLIFLISDLQVGLQIWKMWFGPFEILEYYFLSQNFAIQYLSWKKLSPPCKQQMIIVWLAQKYYSSYGLHYEMGSKRIFVFPKKKNVKPQLTRAATVEPCPSLPENHTLSLYPAGPVSPFRNF